jgi:peptidoglycan-associated lipoprotein
MKCTKFVNLAAAIFLVGVAGAGCKKGPQNPTPLHGYRPGGVGDESPGRPIGDDAIRGIPLSGDKKDWTAAANQPAVLRDNTVYFDYDRATVRASETSKLDAIASYLKSGNRVVRVEGHCDERGTEEYNRSLGERRALAVREYLARAGVDANNVDTISHGEDKPAVAGRAAAAWAKNRRAEFLLLQPPSGVGASGPQ